MLVIKICDENGKELNSGRVTFNLDEFLELVKKNVGGELVSSFRFKGDDIRFSGGECPLYHVVEGVKEVNDEVGEYDEGKVRYNVTVDMVRRAVERYDNETCNDDVKFEYWTGEDEPLAVFSENMDLNFEECCVRAGLYAW